MSSLSVINEQLDTELSPKTSTRGVISRILPIALVRKIRSKDRVLNKAVFKHIYLSIILLFAISDYPGRFYMYSYIVNCQIELIVIYNIRNIVSCFTHRCAKKT